jgi:glycosyltransferase involved in cell wall biosynthesis
MVTRQFHPWVGGTERQAQQLSTRLIEQGLDVKLVTGWWFRGTPQQEVLHGVPIFRNFTAWNMFGLRGLRKLAGYLYILSLFWYLWRTRQHYDILHVHMLSYAAWPAVLVGRWLGKPTIVKVANSGLQSDLLRMRRNDMLPGQRHMLPGALKASCLVGINPEIVAELQAAGVPPERIAIIPNGVDLRVMPKCTYGLTNVITVIYVGRLHPSKGLPMLLKGFRQASQRRPGLCWRLWLLGEGVLRRELETLAAQLHLQEAVTFWGKVAEVSACLERSDLFVLPSLAEGLSNALLEAMVHGLPCVTTSVAGNCSLIRHEETGLLITPESADELADALTRLADDEGLRARLGTAARQLVEADYSLDRVAQRYRALYSTLMANGHERVAD